MSKLVTLGYSLFLCLVMIMSHDDEASRQWKKHKKHHPDEQISWDPDDTDGDHMLKESIGVFKGGPDTYLLTFAEVRPNKQLAISGEDAFNDNLFPPLWQNKSIVRKRRKGDEEGVTVSLENTSPSGQQADVLVASGEAEEVVSSVLKSTENMRKGLGVCRKFVPRNFFNPPLDNLTNIIINSIVGCVEDKLQDDLSCQDCITLHGDLRAFLSWLLHGNPGLACCPSVRKILAPDQQKHIFLFRQEAFGGAKCITKATQIPTICEVVGMSPTIPSAPIDVTHAHKKSEKKNFIRVV